MNILITDKGKIYSVSKKNLTLLLKDVMGGAVINADTLAKHKVKVLGEVQWSISNLDAKLAGFILESLRSK